MSAARSVRSPLSLPIRSSPLLTSSQVAAKHFQGALKRWPRDPLRPECQLQDVLAKRLEKGRLAPATRGATQDQADLKQANALYSLLEDRFKSKVSAYAGWDGLKNHEGLMLMQYRADARIFEPKSNPTYYQDIVKELEEAPNRSWLQRVAKRLGGMVRLQ